MQGRLLGICSPSSLPSLHHWDPSSTAACPQKKLPQEKLLCAGMFTGCCLVHRFLFILLGPHAKVKAYHEIGRAMATLLTDEVSLMQQLS